MGPGNRRQGGGGSGTPLKKRSATRTAGPLYTHPEKDTKKIFPGATSINRKAEKSRERRFSAQKAKRRTGSQ